MVLVWIGVIQRTDIDRTADASCRYLARTSREKVAHALAERAVELASVWVETIVECDEVYHAAFDAIMKAGYVEGDDLPVNNLYCDFHAYELTVL